MNRFMFVHVLLYEKGKDNEGIHSLEINGKTLVLMFEDIDDAERYCLLLEAQDFPIPTIDKIEKIEIEQFCLQSGYESRFVEKGFIPQTNEDRLLITPPENNLDVANWEESKTNSINEDQININTSLELENIKRRLEDLL